MNNAEELTRLMDCNRKFCASATRAEVVDLLAFWLEIYNTGQVPDDHPMLRGTCSVPDCDCHTRRPQLVRKMLAAFAIEGFMHSSALAAVVGDGTPEELLAKLRSLAAEASAKRAEPGDN